MPITNQLDIDNIVDAFRDHELESPTIIGKFGVFRGNRLVNIRGHDWFGTRSSATISLNKFMANANKA